MSPVLRRTVELFNQRIAKARAETIEDGLLQGAPTMVQHGIHVGYMRCFKLAEDELAAAAKQAIEEDDPEDGDAG